MEFCNHGWFQEVDNNSDPDIEKCISVYREAISMAQKWKIESLEVQSIVSISVLQDEYLHDQNAALDVLSEAKFPQYSDLIQNQKAKINFNNKEYSKALEIWEKFLLKDNLIDPMDLVYSLQNAAISAGEVDQWEKANSFFKSASNRSKEFSSFNLKNIGFMADVAFANWKLARIFHE